MNDSAILALLGELYEQLGQAKIRISELENALAAKSDQLTPFPNRVESKDVDSL